MNYPPQGQLPPQLKPFVFDPEKARIAGQRSGESKRNAIKVTSGNAIEKPDNAIERSRPNALEREANAIWGELKAIRAQMAETRDSTEKRDLSAAHSRLFASWQTLTGVERPGVRRAASKPRRNDPGAISPLQDSTPESTTPPLFRDLVILL